MPLLKISGPEAVGNRKQNPYATWGDRGSPNRVEPLAKPAFLVPFHLSRGEKIFTVGSCFARNVESELMRRGFELPVRQLFRTKEFQDIDIGVINNYGTPSIYNEMAWAFGEEPFEPKDHIVEVLPGKFADLHLSPSLRPAPWDAVIARRNAIIEAFRKVSECRLMIMTLGLVECWYDTSTGFYLNVAPRPSLLKAEPDRFELHVLSFDESYEYLERALLIAKKNAHEDFQVLLTVSPVPLQVTHRMEDVLVANMYSKSVLRAVADTIVARHDFVSYYPSYESVMLSERKLAWRDDLVHVTEELVALNVNRMVDAYIGVNQENVQEIRASIATGGKAVLIEKAHAARVGSRERGAEFFREFAELSATSPEFALEHAQFLLEAGDGEGVVRVLDEAPQGIPELQAALIAAEALLQLDRPKEAYARLDSLASRGQKSYSLWNSLLKAAMQTNEEELVLGVRVRWSIAMSSRSARANTLVGRWFHQRGDIERAIGFFRTAVAIDNRESLAHIYLTEALLAQGKRDDAQRALSEVEPQTAQEVKLADRLRSMLQ